MMFAIFLCSMPLNAQNQSGENFLSPALVVNSQTLIIDPPADSQKGTIFLRNVSAEDILISLSAEDFINTTTNTVIPAQVYLEAQPSISEGAEEKRLKAGSNMKVQVMVTNFRGEGDAEASLINNGTKIGVLKVRRNLFDIQLDVPDPANPLVTFERGSMTALVMKNGSDAPLKVKWMIVVNGVKFCGSESQKQGYWLGPLNILSSTDDRACEQPNLWKELYLPPKDKRSIEITPPPGWYPRDFNGIFKNETQPAILRLTLMPLEFMNGQVSQVAQTSWPEKDIRFNAQLSYLSPVRQQVYSTFIIGLTLLLGGIFSLIARNWIPNQLRKRDLREKLTELRLKTSGLSGQIESTLRVLVRVERKRLVDLLDARFIISPDMNTMFTQAEQGIVLLNRRVDMLSLIDSTYERLSSLRTSCPPPSLIDKIEGLLDKASLLLRNNEPHELDFQQAQKLIADAAAGVEELNLPDEKFAEYLSKKIGALLEDLNPSSPIGETHSCQRLRAHFPGPFDVLNQTYTDPAKIRPDDYAWFDMNISVLSIIRDFIRLYEGTVETGLRETLKEYEPQLLQHLSMQSWDQLHSAKILLRQMKEGIFIRDIEEAIRANEVTIEMDPPNAKPQRPVRLSARFRRPELNGSAARERFTCVWDFGHLRPPSQGREKGAWGAVSRMNTRPKRNLAENDSQTVEAQESSLQAAADKQIKEEFPEKGWIVSHYFVGVHPYDISVSFEDPRGKYVSREVPRAPARGEETTDKAQADAADTTEKNESEKIVIGKTVKPQDDSDTQKNERLAAEIVSLAMVLIIALLGLITGAREQVLKLDVIPGLIAVFLLGFGADALKNLLTQRQA
ncbi:MAG: hypothetical protein LC803_21655 [Acidobacteria bacterium]|nr:hypothetical protein [Acidobacteriota bacterium]